MFISVFLVCVDHFAFTSSLLKTGQHKQRHSVFTQIQVYKFIDACVFSLHGPELCVKTLQTTNLKPKYYPFSRPVFSAAVVLKEKVI